MKFLWFLLLATSLIGAACSGGYKPPPHASSTLEAQQANTPAAFGSTSSSPREIGTMTVTTATPTSTPIPSPTPKQVREVRENPDAFQAGVSILIYGNDEFFTVKVEKLLDRLVDDNVNSVSLVFPIFQESWNASKVSTFDQTLSDENIGYFIKSARSRGMTVMVRPIIDEDSIALTPNKWRGNIDPTDRAGWFASYREIILHYLTLAENSGANIFCLGTELNSMVGGSNVSFWREFIPETRLVFSGQLTYSNNWNFPQEVGFWDLLDYVGIDAFYALEAPTNPSEDQLVKAWGYAVENIKRAQATYRKPVLLTEIGIRAEKGAYQHPWYWDNNTPVDLEEQRLYYSSACRATKDVVAGYYWWYVDLDPPTEPEKDSDFDPTGKPAEQALAECYSAP